MNVPNMALEYLHLRHSERVRFERLRDETINGKPVVVLRFQEVTATGLIGNLAGRGLLARGRIWAEPDSGTIVRTELLLEERLSKGSCTVDFALEPRLGIHVPVKMTERYASTTETIDSVARYSDFRRFTVSTGETLIKPPGR